MGYSVKKLAHCIGDNYLLSKAHTETLYALCELRLVLLPVDKLLGYIHIPDYRSCDKLREERHISPKVEYILLALHVAFVYVYDV